MKKTLLISLFFAINLLLFSQTKYPMLYKAEYLYGHILEHNIHMKNLIKGPIYGGEFAIEWQTNGLLKWNQDLYFPKIGLAGVFINLNNPDTLGNIFAIYPYITLPLIKTKFVNLYLKPGAGVSYLTKTFKHATAYNNDGSVNLNMSNAAIGSHLNVYFAGSAHIEFPITKGVFLSGDLGWNHVSNGSFFQPNSGINMMNGLIGLKYSPDYNKLEERLDNPKNIVINRFITEMIVSGGARQLYYQENTFFPVGSISISELYHINNSYKIGLGANLFYDGVFGAINASTESTSNQTNYKRTYIMSNELKNKFRAGISLQHELIIGKLSAGFHVGLYLYDPIKNLEPYNEFSSSRKKKGLIYTYNINKEDGWLFSIASLKYPLSKNIFCAVGLKTHLQKAEFIQWGVGYKL